jgi:hypothetical protein
MKNINHPAFFVLVLLNLFVMSVYAMQQEEVDFKEAYDQLIQSGKKDESGDIFKLYEASRLNHSPYAEETWLSLFVKKVELLILCNSSMDALRASI